MTMKNPFAHLPVEQQRAELARLLDEVSLSQQTPDLHTPLLKNFIDTVGEAFKPLAIHTEVDVHAAAHGDEPVAVPFVYILAGEIEPTNMKMSKAQGQLAAQSGKLRCGPDGVIGTVIAEDLLEDPYMLHKVLLRLLNDSRALSMIQQMQTRGEW